MKKIIFILSVLSLLALNSCDNFLEIQPKDRVIPTTLEDYRGLLTSAYSAFPRTKSKTSVRTDEMSLKITDDTAPAYKDIFLWKDANYDPQTSEFDYDALYKVIFYTNEVINQGGEKLKKSSEKSQLMGEAYALRAYTYFELVNLFAKPYSKENLTSTGVPLVLKVDLEEPNKPKTLGEIYQQIESDIAQANAHLLQTEATEEFKYRFSKNALAAFEARVALYKGEWKKAVTKADEALSVNHKLLDLRKNDDNLFPNQIKSPENIMALDYAIDNYINRMAIVSDEVVKLYNPTEDLRFALYYTKDGNNYKVNKGNAKTFKCSFRVGEILLLKAEALLKLGKENEAKQAIKQLAVTRYTEKGYNDYVSKLDKLSGKALFQELMNERERETAFEGYRWFDLRRNNQKEITHTFDQETATLQKNDPRYTIPFPRSARLANPYLK